MVFNYQSMSINLVQFFRQYISSFKKGWGMTVGESFQCFQIFSCYFQYKDFSFFALLRED
jgi:hypothetical protein